jgi:hypothetical protein
MSGESPRWSADPASETVLMEYLRRVSPRFVAAELDKLGLLQAADEIATAKLAEVAALRASERVYEHVMRTRKMSLWMVALAMCAIVAVIAGTERFVLPERDGSQFMQLAGPTPEW